MRMNFKTDLPLAGRLLAIANDIENLRREVASLVPKQGERGRDGQNIKGDKGDKGDSIVGPRGDKGDTVVGPQGPAGRDGQCKCAPEKFATRAEFLELQRAFVALKNQTPSIVVGPVGPRGDKGEKGESMLTGKYATAEKIATLENEAKAVRRDFAALRDDFAAVKTTLEQLLSANKKGQEYISWLRERTAARLAANRGKS